MSNNLGVYISSLNEENLIRPCIESVLKVFPQVEVIDLDSKDSTVDIIKSLNVPLHQYKEVTGGMWTELKNQFARKHDWVFFVDGDEVFPLDQLEKLKEKFHSNTYDAYRVGWKNLRVINNKFQVSSLRTNGPKLFNTKKFYFKSPWPREVLQSVDESFIKEPKGDFNVWCYHGVLLKRSSIRESTGRRKKRQVKKIIYDRELDWFDLKSLPWEKKSNVRKFSRNN